MSDSCQTRVSFVVELSAKQYAIVNTDDTTCTMRILSKRTDEFMRELINTNDAAVVQ